MHDLWGTEVLLSNSTKEMMQNWIQTEIYFPCTYGLAAMPLTFPTKPGEPQDEKLRRIVGHAGEDWGSTSEIVGYNQAYDFSFAVTMNSFTGLNCSMTGNDWAANVIFGKEYPCIVLDLTMAYISNGTAPRLMCDFHSPHNADILKSLNGVPPRRSPNLSSALLS